MRYGITAFAGAAFGLLALTTPGIAADATSAATAPATAVTYDAGYVTTQGRGGRVVRRGGGGPVFVAPRRRNNTGRNVAIGVGAAILGAAILSQGAQARRGGGGGECRRWSYMCDDGARWACRNYARYC
jgi:hypothetical protein